MDLNDPIIQKQNQNAIENYKRYIQSVSEIRQKTHDCSIIEEITKNTQEEIKEKP